VKGENMARNTITSTGFSLSDSGSKTQKRYKIIAISIFLLLFTVVLQFTTQYIASRLFYHVSLGSFFTVGEAKVYPFYRCLSWLVTLAKLYIQTSGTNVAKLFSYSAIFLVAGTMLSLFLSKIYYSHAASKTIDTLHGSAHWASRDEIIQAGLLDFHGQSNEEGVVVGGYSPKNKDSDTKILRHNGKEHIMAYAPTRSGKGISLVFPTLLDGWNESTFVFDIKGENFAGSAGYRQQTLKHKILKLDFTDPYAIERATSATFNPLEEVRLDYVMPEDYRKYDDRGERRPFKLIQSGSFNETAAIQQIVAIMVDPQGKGLEDHWSKTASSLMLGCITHLLYKAQLEHLPCPGIADVLSELTQPGKKSEEIIKSWQSYPHMGGYLKTNEHNQDPQNPLREIFVPICHPIVNEEAQSLLNKPDKERGSVISTAVANLSLFRDPVVSKNTSRSSFKIKDLMKRDDAVDLYLIVNPNDQLRLLPLTRLFVTQLVFTLVERMEFKDGRIDEAAQYKHRLLLLLDEFPSLGRMELFEKALGFIGGYGLKAFIVCQGLAQLYKVYGKEEAIRAASHIQIAFAPNEHETCEYLSKLTGQKTIIKESISETRQRGKLIGGVSKQISLQEVQRPLLTPDECRRLPGLKKDSTGNATEAGDMLIFPAGYSAIYGRQPLYFMDKKMSERAKQLPQTLSDYLMPDIYNANISYNSILKKLEALQDAFFGSEKNKAINEYRSALRATVRDEALTKTLPEIPVLNQDAIKVLFSDAKKIKTDFDQFKSQHSGMFDAEKIRSFSKMITSFLALEESVLASPQNEHA